LIRERADVGFAASAIECSRLFAEPKFPLRKLGELCTLVQYGSSALASAEPKGWPIIRMNNLQQEGWDFTDLKYLEPPPEEAATYRVERGDILFNRTNGSRDLVGKCEVFDQPGDWLFASYLIRIRINREAARPQFIAQFLNTKAGRAQILRSSRQILMSNINSEEIRALEIPLPPLRVQEQLEAQLAEAKAQRERKLAEADALLTSLDGWLLEQLGIPHAPAKSSRAFAVGLSQIDGPLNPERYLTLALQRAVKGVPVLNVAEILNSKISPAQVAPESEWDWIRIDDLSNQPIEVETVRTEVGSNIEGSLFEVRENDVLLARLGPTILNAKFVLCPKTRRQTVASGEFLVLRCKPGWNPLVVLSVFRTSLFRQLMYSKARGGTPSRYRLNAEDLANLPFPQIRPELQQAIATEVVRRRETARRLRSEAASEWAAAKTWFESELLGRPATTERNS